MNKHLTNKVFNTEATIKAEINRISSGNSKFCYSHFNKALKNKELSKYLILERTYKDGVTEYYMKDSRNNEVIK